MCGMPMTPHVYTHTHIQVGTQFFYSLRRELPKTGLFYLLKEVKQDAVTGQKWQLLPLNLLGASPPPEA